ncbi:hypothetical protein ES703_67373 [subsurface metagenome]
MFHRQEGLVRAGAIEIVVGKRLISKYIYHDWLFVQRAADDVIALARLRVRTFGKIFEAVACILPQDSEWLFEQNSITCTN